jgi:hypothetical protein
VTSNELIEDPPRRLFLISGRVHLHYEIPQAIIGVYLVDYANAITVTKCTDDHPIGTCSYISRWIRIGDGSATRCAA